MFISDPSTILIAVLTKLLVYLNLNFNTLLYWYQVCLLLKVQQFLILITDMLYIDIL